MRMNKYVYGIDFGTTSTTLAILDVDKREVIKVFSAPSSILCANEPTVFSSTGYLNKYEQNQENLFFIRSAKSLLFEDSLSRLKSIAPVIRPEKIISTVFKNLKDEADNFLNKNIKEAVVGRPVSFSSDSKKDKHSENILIRAAFEAGFDLVHVQLEIVATGYYIEHKHRMEGNFLIADLGASKSDFATMRLSDNSRMKTNRLGDVLAISSISLGGDSITEKICQRLLATTKNSILEDSGLSEILSAANCLENTPQTTYLLRLLQTAEQIKLVSQAEAITSDQKISEQDICRFAEEFISVAKDALNVVIKKSEEKGKIINYLYTRGGNRQLKSLFTFFNSLDLPSPLQSSSEDVALGLAFSYYHF